MNSSSIQYTILSMIIGIHLLLLLLLLSSIILPSIRVWATEGLLSSQHLTNANIFDEIKYKFVAAAMCKGNNVTGTFNQNTGAANHHPISNVVYNARGDEIINSNSKLNKDCFFDQRINYSFHNNVESFNNIKGINNNTDSFNNNTGSFNNDKNLNENIGSLNNNKGSFNNFNNFNTK